MIHVEPQPEPPTFDKMVRQPGLSHLKRSNISLDQPLPSGTTIEPFWRSCLEDLYNAYNGVCTYLCVFFERVAGAGSVDHFVAKSRRPGLAYEWDNYRLACTTINSRKWIYDDLLDPFAVENGWFRLELVSGHIYPSPICLRC